MDDKTLENIFTYHAPIKDQIERYAEIRSLGAGLARLINMDCPESREKSLAITKLQECIMWANASIAINEKGEN